MGKLSYCLFAFGLSLISANAFSAQQYWEPDAEPFFLALHTFDENTANALKILIYHESLACSRKLTGEEVQSFTERHQVNLGIATMALVSNTPSIMRDITKKIQCEFP